MMDKFDDLAQSFRAEATTWPPRDEVIADLTQAFRGAAPDEAVRVVVVVLRSVPDRQIGQCRWSCSEAQRRLPVWPSE